LVPLFISLAITAGCLFVSARRLNWWNAWVLLGLSLVAGLAFTLGRNPELTAERRNIKAGKSWDKVIVSITVLFATAVMWITAGLDDRFHWSNSMFSIAAPIGVTIALLSTALIAWAMRSNRFFSSVVRIQKDRGHTVVADGPYRFIRHPGYAGMSAYTLATPLILGSYWAFVPAAAVVVMNALRTALEDRTLHDELEGYTDYGRKVRYKLLPGIW
jgi:protein-S-isoprenylcysteine O-methyltransferase Ste14